MGKELIIKRNKKTTSLEEYKLSLTKNKPRLAEQKKKTVQYDEAIEKRYRYKKFKQRVNEIDVHIANKIQEIKLLPESYKEDQIGNQLKLGSFFYDELEEQRTSNYTSEYAQFYFSIVDESQNLALILNNLEKITDALVKNLDQYPREMLTLIQNLFRDCRSEIYPIFCQKIFLNIVQMLQIEKLDIIEHAFQTLAFALRYFFKDIQQNFQEFFIIFQNHLLMHKNKHIRRFSCETLGWILKKSKSVQNLLTVIFNSCDKQIIEKKDYKFYFSKVSHFTQQRENYIETISYLLKENIKGLDKNLSMKFDIFVTSLFDLVENNYVQNENVCQIIKVFIFYAIQEIKLKNQNSITAVGLESFLKIIFESSLFQNKQFYNQFIEISCFLIKYQFGKYINSQIMERILLNIEIKDLSLEITFLSAILRNKVDLLQNHINLYEKLLKKIENNTQINIFLKEYIDISKNPELTHQENLHNKYKLNQSQFLKIFYLTNKIIQSQDFSQISSLEFQENMYIFYILYTHNYPNQKIKIQKDIQLFIPKEPCSEAYQDLLIKIKFVKITQQRIQNQQIQNIIDTFQSYFLNSQIAIANPNNIYSKQDEIQYTSITKTSLKDLQQAIICEILPLINFDHKYLNLTNIQTLKVLAEQKVPVKIGTEELINNLLSSIGPVRLYSLILLKNNIESQVIDQLIFLEPLEATLDNERNIILQLSKFTNPIENRSLTMDEIKILLCYLLGKAYIRLQTIWSQITLLIKSILNYYEQYFHIFYKQLVLINYQTSRYYQQPLLDQIDEESYINNLIQDEYYQDLDRIDPIFVLQTYTQAIPGKYEKTEDFLKQFLDEELGFYEQDNVQSSSNFEEQMKIIDEYEKQLNGQIERMTYRKLPIYLKLLHGTKIINKSYFLQKLEKFIRKASEAIQQQALESYLKFSEDPVIFQYQNLLKSLQNKKTQRNEMIDFNIENLQKNERKSLYPIIVSILYPRLFNRKGQKNKQSLEINRGIVFSFFSSLNKEEISYLMDLLLQNYNLPEINFDNFENIDIVAFTKISQTKWIGLLNNFKQVINQLGNLILPFISKIFFIFLSMQKVCSEVRKHNLPNYIADRYKTINKTIMKRLEQIFDKYQDLPEIDSFAQLFKQINQEKIQKMSTQAIDTESGLIKIFKIWATYDSYHKFFDQNVIYNLISIYGQYSTNQLVINSINVILQPLIENLQSQEIINHLLEQISLFFQISKRKVSSSKKVILKFQWKPSLGCVKLLLDVSERELLDQKICGNILEIFFQLLDYKFLIQNDKIIKGQNISQSILQVFENLTQKNQNPKYFTTIISLLTYISNSKLRITLISILKNLDTDNKFKVSLELLSEMNTYDRVQMDNSFDYEAVIPACYKFNTEYIFQWEIEQIELIMNHYFILVSDKELSLRMAACSGIETFFSLDKSKQFHQKFLILYQSYLKRFSNDKEEYKIKTLNQVITYYLKNATLHSGLQILFNKDDNQDFFAGIFNISIQRRLRALQYLEKMQETIDFNDIYKIILPFVSYQIFVKSQEISKNKKIIKSQSLVQQYQQLLDQSIETYVSIVKKGPFSVQSKILKFLVHKIESKDNEKIVIRLISKLLQAIDFGHTQITNKIQIEQDKSNPHLVPTDQKTNFLLNRVLRPLKLLMVEKVDDKKKIRVNLCVAIVSLLNQLPEKIFNSEFPKVINNIIIQLRSRELEERDQTRKALKQIFEILGPLFFSYLVKEMSQNLQLGYQIHVCNYTIHYLISSMQLKNGQLDYTFNILIPLLINEAFGEAQEEKDNQERSKTYMELKKSKINETFIILAQYVNFKENFLPFVQFVQQQLKQDQSARSIHKCEEIFNAIVAGINKNVSVESQSVILYCSAIIQEAYDTIKIKDDLIQLNECLVRDNNKIQKITKENVYTIQECAAEGKSIFKHLNKTNKNNKDESFRVLGGFSLKVLSNFLKNNTINFDQHNNFKQLIEQVIGCLETTDNSMISNSLRVIHLVVKWPPIKHKLKEIFDKVILILQKLTISDLELVKHTFSIVKDLLEIRYFVDDQQMNALFKFLEIYIFENEVLMEPLNCFLMIVNKKYEFPQVYDIVDKLSQRMVQTYSLSVKNISKQVLLSFLTDYPVSEKLFQKYMYFLVKNLDYEEPGERFIIIDLLCILIQKLCFLFIQIDLIFYSLIMRLSKEETQQNYEQIKNSLAQLKLRMSTEKKQNFQQIAFEWVNESKLAVQNSGFQCLNILQPKKINLNEKIKEILEQALLEVKGFSQKKESLSEIKQYFKDQDERILNYEKIIFSIIEFIDWNKLANEFINQLVELIRYPKIQVIGLLLDLFQRQKMNHQQKENFFLKKLIYLNFNEMIEKPLQAKINIIISAEMNKLETNKNYEMICQILAYIEIYSRKALVIFLSRPSNQNLHLQLKEFLKFYRSKFFFDKLIQRFIENTKIVQNEQVLHKIIECVLRLESFDLLIQDCEIMTEILKKKFDANFFLSNYNQIKNKMAAFKKERSRKNKELILINPQESAQQKLKKNLKNKTHRKNKILTMKGFKKVKLN